MLLCFSSLTLKYMDYTGKVPIALFCSSEEKYWIFNQFFDDLQTEKSPCEFKFKRKLVQNMKDK